MLSFDRYKEVVDVLGVDEKSKETLLSLFVTLQESGLSVEQAKDVLEIFSPSGMEQLGKVPTEVINAEWREDFDYGNVKIGDYVRVIPGSYEDSATGKKHGGRIGILVFMKSYMCTVRYIGLHSGNTMIHPMKRIQSQKKRYK